MALSDFYGTVERFAQDSANRITPTDVDEALRLAVERYSQDRPRCAVADLPIVNGGMDLPENWEDEFSQALNLEYPIGQRPPANVPNDGWFLYQTPSGIRIEISEGYGLAGSARLTFTRRHVLTIQNDTIPRQHLEAVSCWAAAILCEQLATWYAGNTDTTIQADTVDYRSPASEYSKRANSLRQRYFNELGIDPKRNVAAGAVATPQSKNSLGGPRLTHPLRGVRRR